MITISQGGRSIRLADHHANYVYEITRSFDCFFDIVDGGDGADGAMVRDFSAPASHFYREHQRSFLTPSLPEVDVDYFRLYRPRAGDLVFDVGAYCGVTAWRLMQAVGPSGWVVAFEPDPRNLHCLQANLRQHQMGNVEVVPRALAATAGVQRFGSEGALGSRLARPEFERGEFCQVETMSLGDAIAEWGVPKFVKLDIEGAEVEVLEASRELLRRYPIHFALDTHHRLPGMGYTRESVERIFRECGYRVESAQESGFWTTWASPAADGGE